MFSDFPIFEIGPEEFPALLETPVVPEKLFVRGKLPSKEFILLAVVGSRGCSEYGKEACRHLIKGLSGFPIAIVSGLALGIDSIAHEAALSAHLPTIAIPGSGLNEEVIYPKSNLDLARQILQSDGCLISEFAPDTKATTWTFPKRNRIMAGISKAVLVIEAETKSGTLITARLATDFNRDVFTIPHSIFSPTGEGPLQLLRLGATPIGSSEDILDALGFNTDKKREVKQQNLFSDLSIDEQKIVKWLSFPRTREKLSEKLKFNAQVLNEHLSKLELRGIVKEARGKIYLA